MGQLRDSIRAPFFDAPELQAAARAARARGVEVELLDDHAMDDVDDHSATVFGTLAAHWLTQAADGKITVRVLPPNRTEIASIVAIDADDQGRELSIDANGTITTHPEDPPCPPIDGHRK